MAKGLPLLMDVSRMRFMVVSLPVEKRDEHGRPRVDKRTSLPLYSLELFARFDGGGEVISVNLATTTLPKLSEDQSVTVTGLEAVPWVRGNSAQVSFRATNIVPAASANGKAS